MLTEKYDFRITDQMTINELTSAKNDAYGVNWSVCWG